ncbi:hypothetical protein C1H46_015364 [Malus baccata]|uniref:Uncharacterized protein n=1 Tax=Malus baccata TaxID=106549 RepID=A0A540MJN0_MALBA|nr:hypothetical protein C1H46_015364 [Malus baccata]
MFFASSIMHSEFSLGRGGGYTEQKHATENLPPCYGLSMLSPACSTKSGSATAETGVGDVLYSKKDVRDFIYRQDVEKHRTKKFMQREDNLEKYMKSAVIYRAKRKRRASLAGCLEFLTNIFCLKF